VVREKNGLADSVSFQKEIKRGGFFCRLGEKKGSGSIIRKAIGEKFFPIKPEKERGS